MGQKSSFKHCKRVIKGLCIWGPINFNNILAYCSKPSRALHIISQPARICMVTALVANTHACCSPRTGSQYCPLTSHGDPHRNHKRHMLRVCSLLLSLAHQCIYQTHTQQSLTPMYKLVSTHIVSISMCMSILVLYATEQQNAHTHRY